MSISRPTLYDRSRGRRQSIRVASEETIGHIRTRRPSREQDLGPRVPQTLDEGRQSIGARTRPVPRRRRRGVAVGRAVRVGGAGSRWVLPWAEAAYPEGVGSGGSAEKAWQGHGKTSMAGAPQKGRVRGWAARAPRDSPRGRVGAHVLQELGHVTEEVCGVVEFDVMISVPARARPSNPGLSG
eukprot:2739408-Prymnesium_polylepis.1